GYVTRSKDSSHGQRFITHQKDELYQIGEQKLRLTKGAIEVEYYIIPLGFSKFHKTLEIDVASGVLEFTLLTKGNDGFTKTARYQKVSETE
ncbi:MAG: hypothetical protein AB1540_03485, partial [Bdellovibrionota bacterium]